MGRRHNQVTRTNAAGSSPNQNSQTQSGGFVARFESQQVTYDSVLPPAEELERLEALSPGTIDWFKQLAAEEAHSRRGRMDRTLDLQSRHLWFSGLNSTLGVMFAGTIGICGVVGGLYAAAQGYITDWAGVSTALASLAALMGVFVVGKTRTNKKP